MVISRLTALFIKAYHIADVLINLHIGVLVVVYSHGPPLKYSAQEEFLYAG